jgi:hypothetical protein
VVYPLLVMIGYIYLFCTLRNELRVASVLKFLLECNTGKSNEGREKKSRCGIVENIAAYVLGWEEFIIFEKSGPG